MQAGAVTTQIADDTADCRTTDDEELRSFEYFVPWYLPTLKHGQPSNL
jgi:hypothetical protein